ANWDDTAAKFKSFRDSSGRILRQGARFRIYEYPDDSDPQGQAPREVVIGDEIVDIEWRVHLANRKASFYVFDGQNGANDLYKARSTLAPSQLIKDDPDRTNLRNADVPADDRIDKLDIDPGEKLISAKINAPIELTNPKPHIPIKSLGTLL